MTHSPARCRVDSCLLCPFPLVARDLDGDGCKEVCDCGLPVIGPSPVEPTPFLDTFESVGPVKIGPIVKPGICNNCPNIPFYNSPFCVVGGPDCGPNGILGTMAPEEPARRSARAANNSQLWGFRLQGTRTVTASLTSATNAPTEPIRSIPMETNARTAVASAFPWSLSRALAASRRRECASRLLKRNAKSTAETLRRESRAPLSTAKCRDAHASLPTASPPPPSRSQTRCLLLPCQTGACCTSDGCVDAVTAGNCEELNGNFFQSKTCAEVDYICNPITGACCVANVPGYYPTLCFEGPPSDCPGDYFSCKTCDEIEDLCKVKGACCFDQGGCGVVYEVQCEGVGTFFPLHSEPLPQAAHGSLLHRDRLHRHYRGRMRWQILLRKDLRRGRPDMLPRSRHYRVLSRWNLHLRRRRHASAENGVHSRWRNRHHRR